MLGRTRPASALSRDTHSNAASRGPVDDIADELAAMRITSAQYRDAPLNDITNVAGSRAVGRAKSPKRPQAVPAQEAAAAEMVRYAGPPPLWGYDPAYDHPYPDEREIRAELEARALHEAQLRVEVLRSAQGGGVPLIIEEIIEPFSPIDEVREYVDEIFEQFFLEEGFCMPRADYMSLQIDINAKMRAILVDWLIEVHMKYRLRPETLYLTVNVIDRYLSKMQVPRRRLQLLGVVAMFIAAKFEEIDPPRVNDFVYITDSTYTREDILNMECSVLTLLSFRIVVPTPAHFYDRLQNANRCDAVQNALTHYILELSLVEIFMIRHRPSLLVSAALMLSNELLGRAVTWSPLMVQLSRHTAAELRSCADEFLKLLMASSPSSSLQAAYKKYSHPSQHAVSKRRWMDGHAEEYA